MGFGGHLSVVSEEPEDCGGAGLSRGTHRQGDLGAEILVLASGSHKANPGHCGT